MGLASRKERHECMGRPRLDIMGLSYILTGRPPERGCHGRSGDTGAGPVDYWRTNAVTHASRDVTDRKL
jgi:hypothetical protein